MRSKLFGVASTVGCMLMADAYHAKKNINKGNTFPRKASHIIHYDVQTAETFYRFLDGFLYFISFTDIQLDRKSLSSVFLACLANLFCCRVDRPRKTWVGVGSFRSYGYVGALACKDLADLEPDAARCSGAMRGSYWEMLAPIGDGTHMKAVFPFKGRVILLSKCYGAGYAKTFPKAGPSFIVNAFHVDRAPAEKAPN